MQNQQPRQMLQQQHHQQHHRHQQHQQVAAQQPDVQQSQPQPPRSGMSSPTDSESVFTDDDDSISTNPNDSTIGGLLLKIFNKFQSFESLSSLAIFLTLDRSMRPSESSIENDSIVFTYSQRFSKAPTGDGATSQQHLDPQRSNSVDGLSLDQIHSELNRDIHSSDTENASPAIAFGPKNSSSVSTASPANSVDKKKPWVLKNI